MPETITLQPDGRVTSGGVVDFFDTPDANLARSTDGPVSRGSWRMLGATPAGVHCCDSDMAITIDGMTYTGVLAVLPRETDGRATLTFSAVDRRRSSDLGRPHRGLKPLSLFPSLSTTAPSTDIRPIRNRKSAVRPLRKRGERYQAARRIGTLMLGTVAAATG